MYVEAKIFSVLEWDSVARQSFEGGHLTDILIRRGNWCPQRYQWWTCIVDHPDEGIATGQPSANQGESA